MGATLMRWILVALAMAGCGGTAQDCRSVERDFTGSRTEATTSVNGSCTDMPLALALHLSVKAGAWTLTEGSSSFGAYFVDPNNGCFGYAVVDQGGGNYRTYIIWLDGRDQSYATAVRYNTCMARYDLR